VPSDDRSTRITERCHLHPARPAVARCDECGRPLCLPCAVPVRGRVLGPDCLWTVLGAEEVPVVRVPDPISLPRAVAGAAFAVAVLASLLPWSRFGMGSGALGAWGREPHWSLLAGVAAAIGFAVWFSRALVRPADGSAWDIAMTALGAIVTLGTTLALLNPPPFTKPWLGPWVALPAGAVAWAASIVALRMRRAPDRIAV
jgi:hypothetical protein